MPEGNPQLDEVLSWIKDLERINAVLYKHLKERHKCECKDVA